MSSSRMPVAILVCLLSATGTLTAAPGGLKIWFVDSLTKVFPSDVKRTARPIPAEFSAARNQHLSVQLALRAEKPLAAISAQITPLESESGHVIEGGRVRHVGYVVVGSHTPEVPPEELVGEAPGWFPDPLLDLPFDLPARRTHAIWITAHVPADAPPGVYRGTIEVRSGNRRVARQAFRVRVFAATVPEARSLKVTNWFYFDNKIARQFFDIASPSSSDPKDESFSLQAWKVLENTARVMAEHRQNVILTPLLQLIRPRLEGSAIRYDFADFDRWVETFQKAGVIGYIEGSHLVGRARGYDSPLQVETVQIEDGQIQRWALPPEDPRVEKFLAGFLSALDEHLKAKGWDSLYFQHILDEAHGSELPYYARIAAMVRRYMPGVRTLDAVDAAHMPPQLQNNCDVWVPLLGRFDKQLDLLQGRIRSGHEVWFYTCLYPQDRYLNRLLDFPLLKVRLLHWLNYRYNLMGYLHWGGNYWTPKPMLDTQPVIGDNTELLPPGDAFVMYPDRANLTVYSSIRFEAMLDGIEDYELLRQLRARNPAEADRLARAAVSSFTEYMRDPAVFRKLERSLLEALAK
jgi:hypothetical protein